jgi:hypothetical protein
MKIVILLMRFFLAVLLCGMAATGGVFIGLGYPPRGDSVGVTMLGSLVCLAIAAGIASTIKE